MVRILIFGIYLLMQVGCINSESKSEKKESLEKNKYTHLKYSFYQDEYGNLFEKKYEAVDDIDQEERYFFDSTMFLGEYPNRGALNTIVDIESYQEFEKTPFSRDKNHVYYVQGTSDGHKRWIIENADPNTFVPLGYRWGKDNENVFWQTEIVQGVDLVTFKVNEAGRDSASDVNSLYLNGQKIK